MYLKKLNRNIPEKFKNSFYENSLRPYMPESISTSKSNDLAVLNMQEDFVSESNFEIIFNDSFYYFFTNLPESIDKTKVKISFLNMSNLPEGFSCLPFSQKIPFLLETK